MSKLYVNFALFLAVSMAGTMNAMKDTVQDRGNTSQQTKAVDPFTSFFTWLGKKIVGENSNAKDTPKAPVIADAKKSSVAPKAEAGKAEDVKVVTWFTKENAKLFGYGALGIVAIGGVCYIVYKYKNQLTLKKMKSVYKENKTEIRTGLAAAVTVICSALAYKYRSNIKGYMPSMPSVSLFSKKADAPKTA